MAAPSSFQSNPFYLPSNLIVAIAISLAAIMKRIILKILTPIIKIINGTILPVVVIVIDDDDDDY